MISKSLKIILFLIIYGTHLQAISIQLEQANIKVCELADTSLYNSIFYNLHNLISEASVCDLNDDNFPDLMFSATSAALVATSYIKIQYGPIPNGTLFIDSMSITIFDTSFWKQIDLDYFLPLEYSDSEKYILINRRTIGAPPSSGYRLYDEFLTVNANLPLGKFLIDTIFVKIYTDNFSPMPYIGLLAPNYCLHDSFIVLPGYMPDSFTFSFTPSFFLIKKDIILDTILVHLNMDYAFLFDYLRFSRTFYYVFSPGDLDGDSFNDLIFAKQPINYIYQVGCSYTSVPIPSSHLARTADHVYARTHIIKGNVLFHSRFDTLRSDTCDQNCITVFHKGRWILGPEEKCDIDNDGFNDIILLKPCVSVFETTTAWIYPSFHDTLKINNDSAKLYIIFGRRDFPWNCIDSIQNIADVIIKSNYADASIGGAVSVGDFNGDRYDDILVGASSIAPYVAYLFLGNSTRTFPMNFNGADIKISVDSSNIYFNVHNFWDVVYNTSVRLADINGDSLDDIILSCYIPRITNSPSETTVVPLIYIFSEFPPKPYLHKPDTFYLGRCDTICVKIFFRTSLALHTLLLTVSGDTFTIDSPQVRFFPAESLLCFIPSTEWDTSTIIPFCIERLEDTIGTAMRERWCVRFNDTTWNVSEPPKPRTLSLTCYPNPFNAEVRIRLRMPDASDVKINIYDISGKLIDHIYKTKLTVGWHELFWRPNVSVPSGVYLLRVSAGSEAVVRRVVLVR